MSRAVVPQVSILFKAGPESEIRGADETAKFGRSAAELDRLHDLTDRAMQMSRADGAALAMQHQDQIVCLATAGNVTPPLGAILDSGQGLSGQCMRTGETLVCLDTNADPRVNAEACRQLGARSIVLVPLRESGKTVGVLEVFSRQAAWFGGGTTSALQRLAEWIVAEPPRGDATPQAATEAKAVPEIPERMPEFLLPDPAISVRELRGPRQKLLATLFIFSVLLVGLAVTRSVLGRRPGPPVAAPAVQVRTPEELLRAAAGQGDSAAQFRLAVALENGQMPARNATEALQWLQKAANAGSAEAQYELGTLFAEGKEGVRQDPVAAQLWYLAAQFSGNQNGEAAARSLAPRLSLADIGKVRFQLAQMFASGVALPRDNVSAYLWFTLAQEAGFPAAQEKIKLSTRMSRQEIEAGTRQANAWIEQHRSLGRQLGIGGAHSPSP